MRFGRFCFFAVSNVLKSEILHHIDTFVDLWPGACVYVRGAWVFLPRYCTSGPCTTSHTLGDVRDEDAINCDENENQKAT